MTVRWTRRGALATALAAPVLLASPRRPRAASRTLNVLGHRVHQLSLTTGAAGDLTAPWRQANDADVAWTTLDVDYDRRLREGGGR